MNDGNYQPTPGTFWAASGEAIPDPGVWLSTGAVRASNGYGYHPHGAPSSGLRVAAGILGIVLGLSEFIGVPSNSKLSLFYPVAGLCVSPMPGGSNNSITASGKTMATTSDQYRGSGQVKFKARTPAKETSEASKS